MSLVAAKGCIAFAHDGIIDGVQTVNVMMYKNNQPSFEPIIFTDVEIFKISEGRYYINLFKCGFEVNAKGTYEFAIQIVDVNGDRTDYSDGLSITFNEWVLSPPTNLFQYIPPVEESQNASD